MADKVVPVSRLLDERGLSAFQIKLLIWSFFIVLIDGYDIAAIAFAAPSLVKEWVLKPGALGPVFSASLVGILFGSALFGWVGDRYGRKAALVWSNLLFGVFTLAAAYATNLDQMFWLRLLAGLGIGGVIPNVVAINAESAPRKLRATLAIIAVGCVPIGGAIPGFVTAALVPQHGWQILFLIGGIIKTFGCFLDCYLAIHSTRRLNPFRRDGCALRKGVRRRHGHAHAYAKLLRHRANSKTRQDHPCRAVSSQHCGLV